MPLRFLLAALSIAIFAPAADAKSRQVGFERQVTADGIEIGI